MPERATRRDVEAALAARDAWTAPAPLTPRLVERLGRGLDGWAAVDTFAAYVAGPAWREGRISDATVERRAHSPDRWWRRAAPVSTVPLNNRARGGRGGPSATARTLRVCALLAGDRDDTVVKALSWALRELAKRDPEAARAFVRDREPLLAARVRREVRSKLETGLKHPRR